MFKKKSLSISLPQPCHEDWNAMTDTEKGRFCFACKKEVIDFTQLSDNELFALVKLNKYQVCGKFSESQLNRKIFEQQNTYSFKFKKFAASVLAILSFKFSNSQTFSKPIFDTTISPIAKQNSSSKNLEEYIIYGKITPDNPIMFLLELPVIKIGNKNSTIKPDSLGFYKIVINKNDIKEYTIISFNHPILNSEVRSIHKSNFPIELNINMTNPNGRGLMGVPVFDADGNIATPALENPKTNR